ncbi:hypothetical protein BGW80DRAFT_1253227 [Lactifluus volemus]|nr:hypothetical protein BGW80DRAFT_1253227 [Lactifluus volemus]
MVPPTGIIPLLVFGYLAPCFRTLGALVELVGPSDVAWAMEQAFGVGEVAPLLAMTSLAAQGAWVWVAPILSGVLSLWSWLHDHSMIARSLVLVLGTAMGSELVLEHGGTRRDGSLLAMRGMAWVSKVFQGVVDCPLKESGGLSPDWCMRHEWGAVWSIAMDDPVSVTISEGSGDGEWTWRLQRNQTFLVRYGEEWERCEWSGC